MNPSLSLAETRTPENYKVIHVDVQFGNLRTVLDWLEENCENKWIFEEFQSDYGNQKGSFYFAFENDNDAMTFALKFT